MALTIEDEETVRLAQQLADATGESVTAAVTNAVREKLERMPRAAKAGMAERLIAIANECAPYIHGKPMPDHGELLYNELGFPK